MGLDKKTNEPFMFPNIAMQTIETTPGEVTWKCDKVECIERGGIMSLHGYRCQSDDFKECPYYKICGGNE